MNEKKKFPIYETKFSFILNYRNEFCENQKSFSVIFNVNIENENNFHLLQQN